MDSLVLVVDVVLVGEEIVENGQEKQAYCCLKWSFDGICDGYASPTKPIVDKEIVIWINEDNKSYSLIDLP